MRSYAAMAPDALDALDSEDRHHVYKILKLRVAVYADGALDISGALSDRFSQENRDHDLHPLNEGLTENDFILAAKVDLL